MHDEDGIAVYENGVLRPSEPLPLDEHQKVNVTVSDTRDRAEAQLDHEYSALATPSPTIDQLLRTGIAETRLIRLRYLDRERVVEPHDYGEHKGVIKLLTYQVGGSSSRPLPNWRWMDVRQISDAQLLNQTFAGGRPTASGKHHKWDKLFIRVKPR